MTERTEAWRKLYYIVHRDHAEYCTNMCCDDDAWAEKKTTELYRAIAEEVSQ